ncbi:MAG: hypoxanthine phosphoribosyltransferase [Spiroplasma sp.]|nr:hypoxanthine phosphoribosyltransferase [Spiroplasma sp.]
MIKHDLVKEILISETQIKRRISQLAVEVKKSYPNLKKPLVLIGILRGCLFFLSDFMMELSLSCAVDFMYVESYAGGKARAFDPRIKLDIFTNIKDHDVLIVEDIIDSGRTLVKLVEHLKLKQPKSIKILTLLDKKVRREVEIEADWFGFEVPDSFLVGYGLDYQEQLRNLPYIAIADLEKIKKLEANQKTLVNSIN